MAAPTFVLVHGGMHGGWCWRRVAQRLRAAGADVFTPTLTGLGERAHLNSPQIDLATHVEDIVRCIETEELEGVVLVGHSYGGMVVTGVADRLSGRIASLVYLDALVPKDGQSAMDVIGGPRVPEEILMLDPIPGYDFGVKDPQDYAWVQRRVSAQSALTTRQALSIANDLSLIERHFIFCTGDRDALPVAAIRRLAGEIQSDPAWRYYEIDTGHDAMITAPQEVVACLLSITSAGAAM